MENSDWKERCDNWDGTLAVEVVLGSPGGRWMSEMAVLKGPGWGLGPSQVTAAVRQNILHEQDKDSQVKPG
jgi:hypothetical protein